MKEIQFTKMHGIGNDYVYIDCMEREPERLEELAVEMSDRHTGVGGDGIILILPSQMADFKMRIFNADGSEAMMCGNGTRCIGKYVYDHGLTHKTEITLETLSGVKYLTLYPGSDGKIESVTVDMGEPCLVPSEIPVRAESNRDIQLSNSKGEKFSVTAVSMGNPHGVIFADELSDELVHGTGREIEFHDIWPNRANIEFVKTLSATDVEMRVWERGSGETMACGTGACATAVACFLTGRTGREVTVHLLGGNLKIRWDELSGHVFMTGPAAEVFHGVYTRRK